MIHKLRSWLITKLGGHVKLDPKTFGETSDRKILSHFTKEMLVECVVNISKKNDTDWFISYYLQKRENERLNNLLRSKYHTDKQLNHAVHVSDLETKNKKLKREIRNAQEIAEHRNAQLKACNLITYCTGGCEGGIPDKDSMTEQKVKDVEAIAGRLRSWWNSFQHRKAVDYEQQYTERFT